MSHACGGIEEEMHALFKVNYTHPLISFLSQTACNAVMLPEKIVIPQYVGNGYLKTAASIFNGNSENNKYL